MPLPTEPTAAPEPARPLNQPDESIAPIPVKPPDDAKDTKELIQRLGRQRKEQPPATGDPPRGDEPELNIGRGEPSCTGKECTSALKEDAAMSCYRSMRATVIDGHGAAHNESLYTQRAHASGIANAALQACAPGGICKQAAYDCAGTFFDAKGVPMRVPLPPSPAVTDEELKRWKASVSTFYSSTYTDSKGQRKLSPGQAALCTTWATVYFRKDPDPSLLQAFTELQQIGAEQTIGQDVVWLNGIVKAGQANSCPTPAPLSSHDMSVWFVPVAQAKTFFAHFRDCATPDVNGVGGCPHAFDPRNRVKARYLLDAETTRGRVSVFFGDESLAAADGDCMGQVNACMRACLDANAALTKQCLDLGGVATAGLCTQNVEACSCTQTAPDCKRPSQSKGK